jgi:hypothetical protein
MLMVWVTQTGGARPLVAAFVPEAKGAPASVKLLDVARGGAVVASKTFFQAREATLHWSPTGTDVLVDATIQNASSLYLVSEQVCVCTQAHPTVSALKKTEERKRSRKRA